MRMIDYGVEHKLFDFNLHLCSLENYFHWCSNSNSINAIDEIYSIDSIEIGECVFDIDCTHVKYFRVR